MFVWGVSWPSGKVLSTYGSSFSIAFLRFFVTFLGLLPLLLLWKQPLQIRKEGISILVYASICMSVYSYLFFQGLKHGMPGAGGVLVTTLNPVIAYAIGLGLNRKIPSKKEQIGLGLGLLAGGILLKIWANLDEVFSVGNVYFLLATFTWAILSKFTAKASSYGFSGSFSLWLYLLCSFAMFFLADKYELQQIIQSADWIFYGNLFFSAFVTTSLATTFYFYATSQIGAERASTFIFLVPASAVFTSWWLIHETVYWNTILGGCIGALAVVIINMNKK